jgi:ribosome-binding ATPase YchF (GTP1/OBG family)
MKSQLIRYFTCGPDEVRAWTIRKGTKAPQAAGVIQYVDLSFFLRLLTLAQLRL